MHLRELKSGNYIKLHNELLKLVKLLTFLYVSARSH